MMIRLPAWFMVCMVASSLAAGPLRAQWVWRGDTGWVDAAEPPAGSPAARFKHACALMTLGNYAMALEQLERISLAEAPLDLGNEILLRIVECRFRLGQDEAAFAAANRLAGRGAGAQAAALDRLRFEGVVRAAKTRPALALTELDSLLGYSPMAYPREQWTASELIAAAEIYAAAGDDVHALRTLERCRQAYPGILCPPNAVRMVAEIHMRRALAAKEPSAEARLAREAFDEYLALAPQARDEPRAREAAALLAELEKGTPEMRGVLGAALGLYEGTPEAARAALGIFEREMRRRPGTPAAEAAAYYRCSALLAAGDAWGAHRAAEEFLARHPDSAFYDRAARLAFRSALEQAERGDERALEALDRVLDRDPRGPLADDALLAKGRLLHRLARYPEAARVFRSVVEDYSASENVAEALFRFGEATLAQAAYHPSRMEIYRRAREAFELYSNRYPLSAWAGDARRLAAECREREADHLLQVATFYRKSGNAEAAAVYEKQLMRGYPETSAARRLRPAETPEGAEP